MRTFGLAAAVLLLVAITVLIVRNSNINNVLLFRNDDDRSSSSSTTSQPLQRLSNRFPSLNDTLEMATLSALIYSFRHRPHRNGNHRNNDDRDQEEVCDDINNKRYNFTSYKNIPVAVFEQLSIRCHWYYHDTSATNSSGTGTQVMVVSSAARNYVAVVFAGTDDIDTTLTDADILLEPFGDGRDITLPPSEEIRIHSGFNNAVFINNLFHRIAQQVDAVRDRRDNSAFTSNNNYSNNPPLRLLTTGHSLGGANSLITAVGLTVHYNNQICQQRQRQENGNFLRGWNNNKFFQNDDLFGFLRGSSSKIVRLPPQAPLPPPMITSISFGCPRIGNKAWRDYIHNNYDNNTKLAIWRFVLGWDLVPRLPELMYHVGHTVQLHNNNGGHWWDSIPHKKYDASNIGDDLNDDDDEDDGSFAALSSAERDLEYKHNHYSTSNSANGTTMIEGDGSTRTSTNNSCSSNITGEAYYLHYGNHTLQYASVPIGWYATPFIWVPGALSSHRVSRYWSTFHEWMIMLQSKKNTTNSSSSSSSPVQDDHCNHNFDNWISSFVREDSYNRNKSATTDDDDRPLPHVDDDFWVDPPDDDDDNSDTEVEDADEDNKEEEIQI